MPRKPPPNPFSFFMKELQQEMKANGQRVPNMREMPALASPAWNRMSPEEKAPYEEMARQFKRSRTNTDDGKFTSDGIPIQLLKQQEAEAEKNIRAMDAAIRTMVKSLASTKHIAEYSFYIVGFNILVGTLEELYLPNEIGIVEYSIQEGIKNEYQKFIDPGPIPLGYTSTAKLTSETVHNIPITGFALASSNYGRIYKDIKRFIDLNFSGGTQHIFCHPNDMAQFQKCLDWIKEHSSSGSQQEIVVGNLAVLVAELKEAVDEPYQYKSSVVDAISTNSFDYSPNTLCNFHDEKDNKNCALGYAKRLAYVLSDILCEPYRVEPSSKHFPERSAVYECVTWEPKRELKPVVNIVDVSVKPVIPHVPTTIVRNIRSKFDDEDNYSVTASAVSETSSVVSEDLNFDDDSSFPSLSDRMSEVSISSRQSAPVNQGPSWAQVSSKNKPLRMPRSLPDFMKQDGHEFRPLPVSTQINGVGIGRGRGANFQK